MSDTMSQTNPTAASLPSITALRAALDYGDAKSARCTFFYDDIRHFRRKFTTSTGISGVKLRDWKDAAHQAGLTELTTSYLDQHGNGSLFWPDDKSSQNHSRLQYSTHRDRCVPHHVQPPISSPKNSTDILPRSKVSTP